MKPKGDSIHQILRRTILDVKLHSLTSPSWYDSFGNLIPWSNSQTLPPPDGEVIYNVSSNVAVGYYIWTGATISTSSYGDTGCDLTIELFAWQSISKPQAYGDHYLPIFLESKIDEMGVMVGFSGEMEQVEQICNFSYTQSGNTVTVYNTIDTSKVSEIHDIDFTVDWGDSTTSILTTDILSANKTYTTPSGYTLSISIDTPWTKFATKKLIKVPSDTTVTNPLGTFSGFTVPYTTLSGMSINYLNDLDYTNNTGFTTFSYAAISRSRIDEKKQYGSNVYTGVTTGTTVDGSNYSGYTIEGLYYQDFDDGVTTITGTTSGYTREEVFNTMITRNEHFLGFIDEPVIYSDIFVERGKQGVLEKSLRLSELDNTGELNIYGNGYFNIRKQ